MATTRRYVVRLVLDILGADAQRDRDAASVIITEWWLDTQGWKGDVEAETGDSVSMGQSLVKYSLMNTSVDLNMRLEPINPAHDVRSEGTE